MVEKWKKDLQKISNNLKNINFENILKDILLRNYSNYDIIPLSGYKDFFRIRIGRYRIIIKDIEGEDVKIISIKKRGDVYKGL